MNTPPLLDLDAIHCAFRGQTVIRDLSLQVRRGELLSLLGPSGCGKTTLLRAVAGFAPVTGGRIRVAGEVVSQAGVLTPPEKRRIGLVFQDYALFPHLTVHKNIAFGLSGLARPQQEERVAHMLEVVGLVGLGGRYPHELSGGQQQRVALARALAPRPRLILLDEPFSNLDVDLRERLSLEVRDILKAEGMTGILVTHDQHEAFALGEKIAVMNAGRIVQIGGPFDLYHEPVDRFVANFVGLGIFLPGRLLTPHVVETEVGILEGNRAYGWPAGSMVEILIRPDDIQPDPASTRTARVIRRAFKGAQTLYTLQLPQGGQLLSFFPSHLDHGVGEEVGFRVALNHMVLFQTGEG